MHIGCRKVKDVRASTDLSQVDCAAQGHAADARVLICCPAVSGWLKGRATQGMHTTGVRAPIGQKQPDKQGGTSSHGHQRSVPNVWLTPVGLNPTKAPPGPAALRPTTASADAGRRALAPVPAVPGGVGACGRALPRGGSVRVLGVLCPSKSSSGGGECEGRGQDEGRPLHPFITTPSLQRPVRCTTS